MLLPPWTFCGLITFRNGVKCQGNNHFFLSLCQTILGDFKLPNALCYNLYSCIISKKRRSVDCLKTINSHRGLEYLEPRWIFQNIYVKYKRLSKNKSTYNFFNFTWDAKIPVYTYTSHLYYGHVTFRSL